MTAKNSRRTERGFRIVHAAVPESIFNQAKSQAALSGLKWPEFIAYVLAKYQPAKSGTQPDHIQSKKETPEIPPAAERS